MSEGRGTSQPFLWIGAPFFTNEKLIEILSEIKKSKPQYVDEKYIKIEVDDGKEDGVTTPISIKGVVTHPKYENEKCVGFHFKLNLRQIFEDMKDEKCSFSSLRLVVLLMCFLKREFEKEIKFYPFLDSLWGNEDLRFLFSKINKDTETREIVERFESLFQSVDDELKCFEKLRKKYSLYS